jgi:hypothetical protein
MGNQRTSERDRSLILSIFTTLGILDFTLHPRMSALLKENEGGELDVPRRRTTHTAKVDELPIRAPARPERATKHEPSIGHIAFLPRHDRRFRFFTCILAEPAVHRWWWWRFDDGLLFYDGRWTSLCNKKGKKRPDIKKEPKKVSKKEEKSCRISLATHTNTIKVFTRRTLR